MDNDKFYFIIKVYIALIIQLLITFGFLHILRLTKDNITKVLKDTNVWVYIIISLILILIFAFLPRNTPTPIKLFIFSLFALVKGILFYKISEYADTETINSVLISAILIFFVMSIFAFILFNLNYDIGYIGNYLFAGLLGLIIAHIIMIFNKPSKFMFKIIVYFGLTLFSLFVLYDTNKMLLNYNKNSDVLDSTMNFYLDIINIFSNLFALEE